VNHLEEPSADELAAIVAAVEIAWPRPVVVAPSADDPGGSPWRFSGRWWARPVTARRDRPWPASPA
jgi:hypothetical protein